MVQEYLAGISEASHILGVSGATLRQWTDEGKIRAFITPGGHRRYSKEELKKFMTSRQRMLGLKDLVVEIEDATRLHREMARSYPNTASWYSELDQEAHEYLAHLGRHFLNIIVKYITEPSQQEATIRLARELGHRYGETLAHQGLPLTDSIEAFILHRTPITNAATQLMRKKKPLDGRVVRAIPLIAHIIDEVLVSLVAAHQQHQEIPQSKTRGGISIA